MAGEQQARDDALLHALADHTRRDIVRCAMHEAHSVSALARRYPMSFAAVQKHVAVLERAGLVTKERHGREQRVRTHIDALRRAVQVLDELEVLWRGRIDRMADVLADDVAPGAEPGRATTGAPIPIPNPHTGHDVAPTSTGHDVAPTRKDPS